MARAKKKQTAEKTKDKGVEQAHLVDDRKPVQSVDRGTFPAPSNTTSQATDDPTLEPTSQQKLRIIGCLLLMVAAVFAVTAMEAPFYFDGNREPGEPIHVEDSHIGAPWRYFGISVLWFISAGTFIVSLLTLLWAQRLKNG